MIIKNCDRGVSLYLAIVMMSVILSLGLGISAISLGQTKVLKEMGDSVISFYAAESGVERALFEGVSSSGSLGNGSSYVVDAADPNLIKSVGSYKNSRRAIQITR